MLAGCDVPSLGWLAALDGSGWSEIEPVLARVFDERGRVLPTSEEAVKAVADEELRQLVAGQVLPQAATDRLCKLAHAVIDGPAWQDLEVFASLSFSWDGVEEGRIERDVVAEATVQEAREVLSRGGVRAV